MLPLLLLLSAAPAQARSVRSLTYDELPTQIEWRPLAGELVLDGDDISGSRSDKRTYLEAVLPSCPDAARVEQRRRRRWKIGNLIFFGSIGGVVVSSFVAPEEQAPLLAFTGGALVGGAVALSGVSLQPSIRAFNACAAETP
ncbi:MAG: hypothetical protein H6741_35290 [Alphaproteobacteria bacterium]|nr:hypothetical protein [Alphaproteobacteria bacterium]MCB9797975.1 hypothetical protein [Alphaproteobacteria bacterium]